MRYSLTMTNKNGYTIRRQFKSVKKAKEFASFYPLSVFFAWIYDIQNDEIICQNIYTDKWEKCNNENFIPYY